MMNLHETDLQKSEYQKYRLQVLQLAKSHSLNVLSRQLPNQIGPFGEELYQDYFFSPSCMQTKRMILHIAGTHGVEGYVGSSIQAEYLKKTKGSFQAPILFVHALNPYGMAWFRRENIHNVDLNRNSARSTLSPQDTKVFLQLRSLFSCRSKFEYNLRFVGILPLMLRVGSDHLSRILAQGQDQFADMPFYCGQAQQLELEIFLAVLKEKFAHVESWTVIDVHSGLGPFAHESLIMDGTSDPQEKNYFAELKWPIIDPLETRGYYEAKGSTAKLLKSAQIGKVFHLAQEFGTYNSARIMSGLTRTIFYYQKHQKFNQNLAEEMSSLYFPKNSHWQKQILAAGVQRLEQLVAHFLTFAS